MNVCGRSSTTPEAQHREHRSEVALCERSTGETIVIFRTQPEKLRTRMAKPAMAREAGGRSTRTSSLRQDLHEHQTETGRPVTDAVVQEVCKLRPGMIGLNLSDCVEVGADA